MKKNIFLILFLAFLFIPQVSLKADHRVATLQKKINEILHKTVIKELKLEGEKKDKVYVYVLPQEKEFYDRKDEFTTIEIQLPEALMKYVVSKGSLAMNGVSLTVNNVCDNKVLFMLIPFTLEKTNLKCLKPSDCVNVETDLIAKYIVK